MPAFIFLVLFGAGFSVWSDEGFHSLYEITPDSGQAYELGWVKNGLAKRQDGAISKVLNLDCLAGADEEMKVAEQQFSIKDATYHCNYSGILEDVPVEMGLERRCKLLYNSAFFEIICHEEYSGGAHPDTGSSYYYLDKNGTLVSEEAFAALLAKASPVQADLQKQSIAMQKSCSDWFVKEGERLSKEDLEALLGTATAQRAGVTKEGAPLIGMAYYLVRVARANPCDQKTFWVKARNTEAWKDLSISGRVRATRSNP